MIRINHTWREVLSSAGLPSSSEVLDQPLWMCEHLEGYQSNSLGDDEYLELLGSFLTLGSPEEARRAHDYVVKETYPGAVELIEELNAAGVMTGCLSNTNKLHWDALLSGRFPIVDALRIRLASHELAKNKPDPEVYERFEEAAGVDPWDIVYFDDTPGHVEAGRRRGWRSYLIDPADDPVAQMRRALESEMLLDELHA